MASFYASIFLLSCLVCCARTFQSHEEVHSEDILVPRENNVCRRLGSYVTAAVNSDCYYNPEVDLSLASTVKRQGYSLKSYRVQTEDGYILTLHRIVRDTEIEQNLKTPVLLQHGFGTSSAVYLITGKNSLGYVLFNAGYDVWLGNIRGGQFSLGHATLSIHDPLYWKFSFHEMGLYDLPAFIRQIHLTRNNKDKIIYIGHSMGTTMSFIYSIFKAQEAEDNLKMLISLAPVANMKIPRNPIRVLAAFDDKILEVLKITKLDEFLRNPKLVQELGSSYCSTPIFVKSCHAGNALASGFNEEQLKPENLPNFFRHFFTGLSLGIVQHFAQIINSGGKFLQFDYGWNENLKRYNSMKPSEYDLAKISIPVHLLAGRDDLLADPEDVQVLYNNLNTTKTFQIVHKNDHFHFSHNDFPIGRHVEVLYGFIFKLLQES